MCPLACYPTVAGFEWHKLAILRDKREETYVLLTTNRSEMHICVQIIYPLHMIIYKVYMHFYMH
jgi:hypothetical protein